jgi:hypothetical protein
VLIAKTLANHNVIIGARVLTGALGVAACLCLLTKGFTHEPSLLQMGRQSAWTLGFLVYYVGLEIYRRDRKPGSADFYRLFLSIALAFLALFANPTFAAASMRSEHTQWGRSLDMVMLAVMFILPIALIVIVRRRLASDQD